MKKSVVERIVERSVRDTDTGCLVWTGCTTGNGYGTIRVNSKKVATHRAMYSEVNGIIPDGMVVMHMCDNPPCCELMHLSLGTQYDNVADRNAKGRQSRGEGRWSATVTENEVRELRRMHYVNGVPQIELARRRGMSQSAMNALITGKTWGHVT